MCHAWSTGKLKKSDLWKTTERQTTGVITQLRQLWSICWFSNHSLIASNHPLRFGQKYLDLNWIDGYVIYCVYIYIWDDMIQNVYASTYITYTILYIYIYI